MAKTSIIAIIAIVVIAISVVAWFLWTKYWKKEKFGTDGIADLGQNCEDKSCCNGTCIRVGDSKKCMYVLQPNQCGCDADNVVCVAGAKCKNNVCLAPRQKAQARISSMTMKQCQRLFVPTKKVCNNIIDDQKAPLPKRVDYSSGVQRYDAAEK